MKYSFHELTERDLPYYEQLASENMHDGDWYTTAEITNCQYGPIKSWWLKEEETVVGWCSVIVNGCYPYDMPSTHLLGGIILPSHRGKRLAHLLWQHRLTLYADKILTVSIRPGHAQSEHLATVYGFNIASWDDPWNHWERVPCSKR